MIKNNAKSQTGDCSSSIPSGSLPSETCGSIAYRFIAYCGNDCTKCPQYLHACSEGCLGSNPANYCNTCAVRRCNLEKKMTNCAYCDKYPCQVLEKQYDNMKTDGYADWAIASKTVLDEILQFNTADKTQK